VPRGRTEYAIVAIQACSPGHTDVLRASHASGLGGSDSEIEGEPTRPAVTSFARRGGATITIELSMAG